jgi:hypothetical protein
MDPIPFEKVTVEEAKAKLKADTPAPPPSQSEDRWKLQRQAQDVETQELSDSAFVWLAQFKKGARPDALARRYPRIANKLADLWKRPLQCERYLDELLLDHRGNRQGFPPDVATEIAALKVYFLTYVAPASFGIWGDRLNSPK